MIGAGRSRGGRGPAALAVVAGLALGGLPGCAGLDSGALVREPFGSAKNASAELHFLVARDHELAGEVDEAVVAYGRALAKDPDSTFLLRKLAELSARQSRIDDALAYAERALEVEPDDLGTRLFLGTLYRFQKDVDRAEQVLRDEAGEPLNPDAALLLYGLLADAERYDEAKATARWRLTEEPDGLRGHLALYGAVMRSTPSFPKVEREMIALVVSQLNGCHY